MTKKKKIPQGSLKNQAPASTNESKSKKASSDLIYFVYLGLLSVIFFATYTYIFDPKIGLSGDNIDYYILGKSIATGKGYCNISHPSELPATHFPPGYPFIISLLILIKDSIATIKIANGLFYLASLILSFFVFKRLSGSTILAFVTSLIVLLNFNLLSYSTDEMSEIPFLFFATLTVVLMMNLNTSLSIFKNPIFYFLVICLSFSYYIRTAGISLVFGVCFYLGLQKQLNYLFATFVLFVLSILQWTVLGL
ncbi:MAG: hypothetical protein K2Q22_04550, partial [Cytophagales bacterium]|nr:hypothetical protein [Cytophagales bacterium]